jgi:hypothetical protein
MSQWRQVAGAVVVAAGVAAAGAGAAGTESVSGKFLGNGKEAKLAHAVAVPHEPWDGKEAWTVVLSEQAAPAGSKPDWDGPFGKLGAALAMSVTVGGDLFGTEVYHPALEHKPFSSVGTLKMEGFKIENGVVSGHLFMKEPDDFFGDTWQVDLTFSAPQRK